MVLLRKVSKGVITLGRKGVRVGFKTIPIQCIFKFNQLYDYLILIYLTSVLSSLSNALHVCRLFSYSYVYLVRNCGQIAGGPS